MFGQVVVGPPGSGKSTYCRAVHEFLSQLGRPVAVINLDPANDSLPYECSINLQELITVEDVMDSLSLGPNGALVYCMEYLEKHLDWLKDRLDALRTKNGERTYIVFDFPGQVELYAHHNSVKSILKTLEKWGHRLVAVNLVDSHYCSDPGKFISVLLTCLMTMLQLEMPHINVLSKIDLAERFSPLPFDLEYFTEVMDLKRLIDLLPNDAFVIKHKELSDRICDVVEDYGLVSFHPLNVSDKECMRRILTVADKANGYCFGDSEEERMRAMLSGVVSVKEEPNFVQEIKDKYCKDQ